MSRYSLMRNDMELPIGMISSSGIKYLLPQYPPTVQLIDATPSKVVALATRGYTGRYDTDLTPDEEELFWQELGDTKLKTPLEFGRATFLISGVTRSFTHQMARYRMAAIVQESLRFSIQTMDGVGGNPATVRVPQNIYSNPAALEEYCDQVEGAFETYWELQKQEGVNTEDARSSLPIGVVTRLFVSLPLNSWAHIYEQRMCCQAQSDEWTPVMRQVKEQLAEVSTHYGDLMKAPWEDRTCTNCGFGASFDRPCKFQEKFDGNLLELYVERFGGEHPFDIAEEMRK